MNGIKRVKLGLAAVAAGAFLAVGGLLLAGQDVISPGLQGACMGGLLAAAWAEPSLWTRLQR